MVKYIIKGVIKNRKQQFTRSTLNDAIGIAENFNIATVYEKQINGLMSIIKCKKGVCKPVTIETRLKRARKLAIK